jgi:hypothetical protein
LVADFPASRSGFLFRSAHQDLILGQGALKRLRFIQGARISPYFREDAPTPARS